MARFSFDAQPNTVQIIRNTMDNGTDVFVISIPEYERLKLSVADEKRYLEEYLGEVIK